MRDEGGRGSTLREAMLSEGEMNVIGTGTAGMEMNTVEQFKRRRTSWT